ncbi:aspartate aminotransferase [Naegleria gruberi]|uniref:Aspartate aminotransferase n=1 Tax=Naegleria gruberi TaxID=5762 RepID=D2UYK0_NAEGR|nr:aspartate aminotransferase [Naegleria gruberi]EFC50488.1 aspartate aminotransferase [Naegleria gruberi]|eukprot:XP_002683232.1 aspartate aminotransferase [Naegleria gruberi strain NEG-M]
MKNTARLVLKNSFKPSCRSFSTCQMQQGIWAGVNYAPLDAIKQLTISFNQDTAPNKILLGEGVYRTNEGKPKTLPSVREAEKIIFEKGLDHEYPPVTGVVDFCKATQKFAFGENSDRIATVQSISGTGSLCLAACYIKKFLPADTKVYFPNPTWVNHFNIFRAQGFTDDRIPTYRYFDKKTNGMDVQGALEDIKNAPAKSVILLHACAHNPTGVDPTMDTWKKISDICKEKQHYVLFDSAYQAFASGDANTDAQSFRLFVKEGHQIMLCQSYAKNFGLYGQRIGAFNVVTENAEEKKNVESQLGIIIRTQYSNPPLHGARLVTTVLNTPELKAQWEKDVKELADRIKLMRAKLVEELKKVGSTRDWSHITNQIGMFAFSGLNEQQVTKLKEEYHIYMTKDGRISISGLNTNNVATVAKAMHEVTKN